MATTPVTITSCTLSPDGTTVTVKGTALGQTVSIVVGQQQLKANAAASAAAAGAWLARLILKVAQDQAQAPDYSGLAGTYQV